MFLPAILLVPFFFPFVVALDNGLARTPPMGWMHWERYRCVVDCETYPSQCIHENLFKKMGVFLKLNGYVDAGYEYIMIDDCWMSKTRDEDGKLQADPTRFPGGIKNLANFLHGLGLKLGIYGDYGNFTCGGYPGSMGYLQEDANTFAEWEVDYLKFDGCYVDEDKMEEGYVKMSQFLNKTGREIVFSCSFPAYEELKANYSLAMEYCNLYRNYDDIDDSWESVWDISQWFSDNQDFLTQYSGPGHWNDPDMLIIGDFGLSYQQSLSQMTMWSLLAAPLIMSVDLENIQPEYHDILLNKIAIKINQDPAGIPGRLIAKEDNINVWKKFLSHNSFGLGFVSGRTDGFVVQKVFKLEDYGIDSEISYVITDAFNEEKYLERMVLPSENITINLPPSGAVLFLVQPIG